MRAPAAVATRAMGAQEEDMESLAPEERAAADAALEILLDKLK